MTNESRPAGAASETPAKKSAHSIDAYEVKPGHLGIFGLPEAFEQFEAMTGPVPTGQILRSGRFEIRCYKMRRGSRAYPHDYLSEMGLGIIPAGWRFMADEA